MTSVRAGMRQPSIRVPSGSSTTVSATKILLHTVLTLAEVPLFVLEMGGRGAGLCAQISTDKEKKN